MYGKKRRILIMISLFHLPLLITPNVPSPLKTGCDLYRAITVEERRKAAYPKKATVHLCLKKSFSRFLILPLLSARKRNEKKKRSAIITACGIYKDKSLISFHISSYTRLQSWPFIGFDVFSILIYC